TWRNSTMMGCAARSNLVARTFLFGAMGSGLHCNSRDENTRARLRIAELQACPLSDLYSNDVVENCRIAGLFPSGFALDWTTGCRSTIRTSATTPKAFVNSSPGQRPGYRIVL